MPGLLATVALERYIKVMEETIPTSPVAAVEEKPKPSAEQKKQHKIFRHGIDTCKQYRRKLVRDWQLSVVYRRGKPYASLSDEDRVSVPLDWSLTKEKESYLF